MTRKKIPINNKLSVVHNNIEKTKKKLEKLESERKKLHKKQTKELTNLLNQNPTDINDLILDYIGKKEKSIFDKIYDIAINKDVFLNDKRKDHLKYLKNHLEDYKYSKFVMKQIKFYYLDLCDTDTQYNSICYKCCKYLKERDDKYLCSQVSKSLNTLDYIWDQVKQ